MNDALLKQVESLKNMLVSRATGGFPDEHEYKRIRRELLGFTHVAEKLPRFVHTCRDLMEFWGVVSDLPKYAHRREFIREGFESVLTMLESESRAPADAAIRLTVEKVDSAHVQEAWCKALERRSGDPEGAITAARTLLESVCKHILDQSGVAYEDSADLPKLYGLVSRQLMLAPSQHTEPLFKQILGGCHTVVEGLGAIRNRLSDAHGKGRTGVRPVARHAELAVNLAGAAATFLLSTWEARTSAAPVGKAPWPPPVSPTSS